jgi:hypothetical protein
VSRKMIWRPARRLADVRPGSIRARSRPCRIPPLAGPEIDFKRECARWRGTRLALAECGSSSLNRLLGDAEHPHSDARVRVVLGLRDAGTADARRANLKLRNRD